MKRLGEYITHENVREFSKTLNKLCVLEVAVVIFFCWMCYSLLQWYMLIVTAETFLPVAFWAAITGIVASIFTAVKSINETHKEK
jgi:flagellar biosynthesis protein FliQ